MLEKRKKIYAYIDESGQDTKGLLFVVSVWMPAKESSGRLMGWKY
jgi:hypothetical protein